MRWATRECAGALRGGFVAADAAISHGLRQGELVEWGMPVSHDESGPPNATDMNRDHAPLALPRVYAIDVPTPLAYGTPVIFVETPVFTAQVTELLSDEEYARLQWYLAATPDAGDVIAGTGGLRKVRWRGGGKGKRGGVRVIYFHVDRLAQIRMLLIYRKGIKDDLTADEARVLKAIKDRWE